MPKNEKVIPGQTHCDCPDCTLPPIPRGKRTRDDSESFESFESSSSEGIPEWIVYPDDDEDYSPFPSWLDD